MPKAGSGVSLDGQGIPLWLCLELTYRCPLKCPWCNNPLDFEKYRSELTTEEWKKVLRQGRELGSLQLGFTGGEPAMRRDLEELVEYADGIGYYTNLITSGMYLDRARLEALKKIGLKQIQLSIQAPNSDITDSLVGAKAFEHKLEIAKIIKDLDFPMVLNVPVCRQNIDQTPELLEMAEEIGVDYLEFANIQYYNWALLNRDELLPSRAQIDTAEAAVNAARERLGHSMTIYFVIPDYYDGRPKACMNGWGNIHLTIAPDGKALPCQEARVIPGIEFPSVREHELGWIWHDSPAFNKFRGDSWMSEPCSTCNEKTTDFAGCRCQAYLLTGDAAKTDPACTRSLDHGLIEDAVAMAETPRHFHMPLVRRRIDAVSTDFTGRNV